MTSCYVMSFYFILMCSGIDLSAFSQQIFGLSKKQLDAMDLTDDMNNVKLLEQAKITRELTRIRYANFTAKYKNDSRNSRSNSRAASSSSSSRGVIRKSHSVPYNSSKNKSSSCSSGSSNVNSSGKRLLSSAMKMSIDEELSMKSRSNKK